MSVIFDSTFAGTAGDTIDTTTPTIGSPLVHLSGTGTVVVAPGGAGAVGSSSGSSDQFGFTGVFEGVLTDITFGMTCLALGFQSVNVGACCYSTYSILAGIGYDGGTGNYLWFLNQVSPNFPFGGVTRANTTLAVGRTYVCRLLVTPYFCNFYVDGNLIITIPGTDELGFTAANVGQPTFFVSGDTFEVIRLRVKVANPRPTSRTIPTGLATALQGQVTTMCMCYLLLLGDGTLMGFTTHDQNVTLNGQLYNAMSSVQATNVRFQTGGQPDNLDVNGLLSSDLITESDMLAGRYDNAQITIYLCDWSDPSLGAITLFRGNIGDVKIQDNQYTAAVKSQMQRYQQQLIEATSQTCRVYHLGDLRCKIDLTGNTVGGDPIQSTGTVSSVVDAFTIELTGMVAKAGFYQNGTVLGLTGLNTGYTREVKIHSDSNQLDVVTINSSAVPASNIGYKPPLDFTPSISPVFTVPAGFWRQITLLVNSTWYLRHALTVGTDQLCIQLPWGQQYDTVLRASATPTVFGKPGTFNDSQLVGTEALYAINAVSYAGGGSFEVGLRHTAAVGTGAPFFNIDIDNLQMQLLGTLAGSSSRLVLHEPFPFVVSPGDTFQLTAGCDRTNMACTLKFDNIINFRGEPEVPGADALMQRGRPPA